MRDQEIIGLYEAYHQVCENSEILSERDEMEKDPYTNPKTGKPHTWGSRRQALEDKKNTKKEEFETWVNDLVEEGYDLSEYTWDDMYEIYMEEVEQLDEKLRERPRGLPVGPVGKGFRKLTLPQRQEMMKRAKKHTRDAMNSGEEYGKSHSSSAAINSALNNPRLREGYDLFDTILEHLVAEGYADTNEAALVIMANMSEEWRQSIVEGMFDFLPKSKGVIVSPDNRNPLQKYSDAVKQAFSALPKSTTVVVPAKPARSREFTNPPS